MVCSTGNLCSSTNNRLFIHALLGELCADIVFVS